MKEAIEKYLKAIGADAETIAALKADETPEEFNMDDAVNSFNEKRKDLFLNNSEAMKELKKKFNAEQYPAIIKPLQKAIKDSTGLTAEEFAAAIPEGEKYPDTKELIRAGIAKMKTQGAQGVDEVTAKLHELQKNYDEKVSSYESKITEINSENENKWNQRIIKDKFYSVVLNKDILMEKGAGQKFLYTDISNEYSIKDVDGVLMPFNPDGTKVSINNEFVTVEKLIDMRIDSYKIGKKSNGGTGGSGNGPGGEGGEDAVIPSGIKERIKSGKLSPEAQRKYDAMMKKE